MNVRNVQPEHILRQPEPHHQQLVRLVRQVRMLLLVLRVVRHAERKPMRLLVPAVAVHVRTNRRCLKVADVRARIPVRQHVTPRPVHGRLPAGVLATARVITIPVIIQAKAAVVAVPSTSTTTACPVGAAGALATARVITIPVIIQAKAAVVAVPSTSTTTACPVGAAGALATARATMLRHPRVAVAAVPNITIA